METSYEPISQAEFDRIYRTSLVQKDLREQVDELTLTQLFDPYGVFVDGELRLVVGETVVTGSVRGQQLELLVVGQAIVPPEYRRQGTLDAATGDLVASCVERDVPFAILRENKNGFYRQYGVRPVVDRRTWECRPTVLLSAVDEPAGEFREVRPEGWEQLQSVHTRYTDQFSLSLQRTEAHWRWVLSDDFGTPYRAAVWVEDSEPRGYVVYDVDGDRLVEIDSGYVDARAQRHVLYYLGLHEPECETVVFEGPDRGRVFDLVGGTPECSVSQEVCLLATDVVSALDCAVAPPTDRVVVSVSRPVQSGQCETFEVGASGSVRRLPEADEPDVSLGVGALVQLVAGHRSPARLDETGAVAFHTTHGRQTVERMFPSRTPFVRDDI